MRGVACCVYLSDHITHTHTPNTFITYRLTHTHLYRTCGNVLAQDDDTLDVNIAAEQYTSLTTIHHISYIYKLYKIMRPARCIVALALAMSVMIAVAAGSVVSADDEEALRSNEEEEDEEDEDGRARRSTSDSLLGMEFDDETGEELLRSYVPADNSVVDLQKLGGAGDTAAGAADTTIVLMGDQHSLAKQPQIVYQVGVSTLYIYILLLLLLYVGFP